jgi:hypothetical protein
MSIQPLLPSDYYLMQALAEAGVEVSEEDWRDFKAEVRRRALEGPQPAVVAGTGAEVFAIIALVTSLISTGLTIVAQFFKPKPGRPAQLDSKDQLGTTINSQRRYAPRSGFDAVQEPATIGSTIPLIYALRESYGGGTYGGIRINMPLLWSQVQSYGRSQLLRAIFLVSEGQISSLDLYNFAIGNNAISGYDLMNSQANRLASRITVYFRPDGGRIRSADRVLGRNAAQDEGNAENYGGQDVFAVQRATAWHQDFSSTSRPNTQTTFGLFSPIGSNLGFRINPSLRSAVQPNLLPKGDEGDARVRCTVDDVAKVQREKFQRTFSTRSGLIRGSVANVGAVAVYCLDNTSDADTIFSTVVNPDSWEVIVEVLSTTGDQMSGVPRSLLTSFVLLGTLGVDTINEKLRLEVLFRAEAATQELNSYITRNGTFQIRYGLTFRTVTTVKRDVEELQGSYEVTVNRSSTDQLQLTSSGSYSAPTLINLGDGNYSLTSGSASSNNYTLVTTTRFSFSPVDKTFDFDYLKSKPAIEKCGDVASAVAGRQKTWDDAIVIGDLYKIGTALAICTGRSPSEELFESEQDFLPFQAGGGQAIEASFTTVRPGFSEFTSLQTLQVDGSAAVQPQRFTATSNPHLHRIAIASFATSRPCRVVEIGIRSTLGLRVGGLCNFSDALTFADIDGRACENFEGKTVKRGQTLRVQNFQSGVVSTAEERYSFFRISYREAGTENSFTELSPCFGVRSITQQNTYNAIRFRMPDIRQWEFRIEPLSGWEIRSGNAGGDLEVLDSKLSTSRSIQTAGIIVNYKGIGVPRSKETFAINSTRRLPGEEIGLGFTDDDSYVDAWGKLAETFVYEEIQSSASNPEHEIVYINEIVPNEVVPTYGNLAIVGLSVRSSIEFQQFAQFSAYVTGGIICRRLLQSNTPGPSHLFPDVLLDLLTNVRYGRGDMISDELIDFESFRSAAEWCQERGYFFDGAIVGRENLRQWAADVAATHLLIFGEANGRFFLRPAFPTGTVPIRALFTAGNIREGSFRMQYLEAEERQPIQVSVRYRQERASSNLGNPGLFPIEREILVREAATPDTAPIESVDLSDYATNPQHAIDAAKYIARFRSTSTHGIRFETTYEGVLTGLAPGDFIRMALDTNVYDEFNNGIVTPAGALVSTQPLADGPHNVIQWAFGSSSAPSDGSINVSDGGTRATPTGIVFTVKRPSRQVQTYQVESIEPSEEGYLAIEAVHMPTDASGTLRLAAGLFEPTGWIIQT